MSNILGHFGKDCDLKTYGLKIAARGGKVFKKKATVVVARKLADMIYTLWQTCEAYDLHHKKNHLNLKAP